MKFPFFLLAMLLSCLLRAQAVKDIDAVHRATYDSILQAYRSSGNDSVKLTTLASLIKQYHNNNNYTGSLPYITLLEQGARRLAQQPGRALSLAGKKGEGQAIAFQGDVYLKEGHHDLAIRQFTKALAIFTAIKDQRHVANTFSRLSSAYSGLGNFNESLKYSFRALKMQEALGDKNGTAIELNNIGATYTDLGNHAKSLGYTRQALKISEELGDKNYIAMYTGNLASSYKTRCDSAFDAGNLQLSKELETIALGYYFKALKLCEEVSNDDHAAVILEDIGLIYSNDDQNDQALPYLYKALAIYQKLRQKPEESFTQRMIGNIYMEMKNPKKAEPFYKRSLELAEETGSRYLLMNAAMGMSKYYEEANQPAKALVYYKEYISNRDSIYNRENTKAVTRTEMNYEFEKKQAETKFKNDKIIYQLEADNKLQRQTRVFLIIGIVLATVLLFFAKRAYDNKKKYADWLGTEDRRKELLLQEVHHRINNNLQIISGLLTLQANSVDDPRLHDYLMQSQNRIQSLSSLHELLYDTNSPLEIDMREYIHKVLSFHRDVAETLPVKVEIRADVEQVKFPTKMAIPLALIVNELVTNAFKYAFKDMASGIITIRLSREETGEHWIMSVSDSGKGMPEDSGKRKNSLGLRLVNMMVRQLGATLSVDSDNGATFNVRFRRADKK